MPKWFRNSLKCFLFFPTLIWINGCKNVDNSKNSNYFFYNEDQSITTLDPAFAKNQSELWVIAQMFEGLVEYDDSLHIRPALAKSWTITDSGTLYTFNLRGGVYFHSTGLLKDKKRQLTASDFVYSFKRIADPKTASPGAWIFNDKMDLRYFRNSDSFAFPVEAINDTTLRIRLLHSFSPFLGILAMSYCSVVPYEAVGTGFREHPTGTGPFMLIKWEEEVTMLLRRNPDYYRSAKGQRLPYLDGIVIDNVKNKQTAFLKFVQGEYDYFNGIDASIKDELLTLSGQLKSKYSHMFRMQKSPFLNTEYLGFNIDKKFNGHPLNNVNVRKAIQFAVDRERMITFLRNGIGTPGKYGFVPAGLPGYPYHLIPEMKYNMDSARYYLKKSGIDVKKAQPIVIHTTSDYLEFMVYIQKELNNLGLEVKIEVHPASFLRKLRNDQAINCFRGSWFADYPDAEDFMVCFETRNFGPGGPNYFHYSDPTLDEMVQASNRALSDPERLELLAKADRYARESVPCVIIYYDQSIRLTQNWVEGLYANPGNLLRLREVRKDKL